MDSFKWPFGGESKPKAEKEKLEPKLVKVSEVGAVFFL